MRNIYLIRHGQPDFPDGKHMCLGRTDLPLSKLGCLQAALLGAEFADRQVTLFSSPLLRATQTARAFGKPFTVLDDFRELDMGQWDGLTFDEIRRRFPELYAARATDKTLPFPDAENRQDGLKRFTRALEKALSMCSGDVAVITHSAVMELFLDRQEKLPYTAYAHLMAELGSSCILRYGIAPHPVLDRAVCHRLLDAARTPENIVSHCRCVAQKAANLAAPLLERGFPLDMDLIEAGALLHDIARTEDLHAQRGAWYLDKLGYPKIAGVIRSHCDCTGTELNEEAIVFLADKLILGTTTVTIQERFSTSWKKCRTEEEKTFHSIRKAAAAQILATYTDAIARVPD